MSETNSENNQNSQQSQLPITPKTKDILAYESEVWTSADVLRSSVGLKNSEFPDFMMPFFALRMVESRLIRKYNEVLKDVELITEEDRIEEIKSTVGFYNSKVIEEKITLASMVKNDLHFNVDFKEYLDAFDPSMKSLLGIVSPDKTENLNLMAVVDSLRKKNALFGYVTAWARIDFTPYDNSEITTLEEHIKRKWADMSAETAGEQYTPDDIINLISELIVTDELRDDKIYKLYDMTCGGGNMLFGTEDKIKRIHKNVKTATYGQELRGSLFALSKIESMFRRSSTIEHGNTLTNDKIAGNQIDYGVANPPYGVSWKEEQQAIFADETGRFGHGGYPSSSDAQLLFVQHMIEKLNDTGKAFIVLNGSPLFSGDAGSGESGIRKWILDNDYLEALIQLPSGEFFNTSITTYIWCFNKNKREDRKDKILCINAEEKGTKLKKTKGVKTQEITPDVAKEVSNIYAHFKSTDYSKVVSKFDFYFNKQIIKKLERDEEFGAFNDGKEGLILKDIKSVKFISKAGDDSYEIITNELKPYLDVKLINDKLKESSDDFFITVITNNGDIYSIDEQKCIIKNEQNLGYGTFIFKFSVSKATAKKESSVSLSCSIESVWSKDEEKINYSNIDNESSIKEFLVEWVSDNISDIEILDNVIGVEINFNSIFSKNVKERKTVDILDDIKKLNHLLREF
jgi:type I restriction enzyme M protein